MKQGTMILGLVALNGAAVYADDVPASASRTEQAQARQFGIYFGGMASQYDRQAEAAVRKAMQISPNFFWAHYQLGNVLVLRGKLADALATFQEEPEPDARLYGLALVNFALGRRQASDAALKELTKLYAGDWAAGIATVHAYRGEVDQAYMWLERAYLQKDTDLCTFKGDPMSAKIWPDPRYKLFLRKLNLPE